MIKKTVVYTDYEGNERKEILRFNISKAELYDMDMSTPGGLANKLQTIMDKKDGVAMYEFFKYLIQKGYGVMSSDGRRFIKSQELFDEFSQTEAYSELLMDIIKTEENATEFFTAMIPYVEPPAAK